MEEDFEAIRDKRKAQLRRQAKIEKVKKWLIWIVAVVFWLAMAYTFLGSCIGTFIKSSDEPQEDYEEYFQNNIP